MTYKSKQSKKTALFSKFLQVFKSRATGVAGFHDTLHYHDKFPPFYICTDLIVVDCKKRSRLLQQKRRCCYSSDVAKLMFSS